MKTRTMTKHRVLAASVALAAALATFTSSANSLAHRWSFNGNLNDSVGTAAAQPIKSSVNGGVIIPSPDPVRYVENSTAVQTGADQFGTYATSLSLGQNLVSTNDVTIEIWATRRSLTNNARLFDWGTGGYNADPSFYVCLPWNDAPVIWTRGGGGQTSSSIASCFANNVKYHLAFTVTQDGTSSKYHLVRRSAADISDVKSVDHTVTSWTLSNVIGGRLYLGHSQWNNERSIDSNAIYDEVRIWNGVVPGELLALNAAMGPDTLVLSYDANGKACITISANGTLPVNANTLGGSYTLDGSVTLGAGAKIVFDNANFPGGMTFTAEGGFTGITSGNVADYVTLTSPAGYAVNFQGNTISVVSALATSWTGSAGDGNWANAANWSDGVPTANSDVTILSTATSMPLTTGACKTFSVAGGALSADCDWSGLAVKPTLSGAVNLNGHNLTLPALGLTAYAGAAFSNSAATDGEVRFYANGDPVTVTEATFIDGIANLTTAAKAKIVLIRSSSGTASGTLNVGAMNNHTVFRAESGTVSMSANGQVGMVSGGVGYLDITGGTVDFCTAKDRGISLGGASARAFMTISGGKLRANWIDAGHNDVTECTIVQTGGEVETGINNNGNIWLGRNARGRATYTLSGGSINVTRGTFDVGNYGTATFTQDGGSVYLGSGDIRVGMYSAANGTYTLNDGSAGSKYWLFVGKSGTGAFTQNGGAVTLKISDTADGNWVNIGEAGGSKGVYTINGGTLEVGTGAKGGGIFMGEYGGTGSFVMNGGTVTTPTITSVRADSTVKLNGGTIKVASDGGTDSSRHASDIGIIKNVGNLLIGNGTTIDTDGHNTKIVGGGYETLPGSALVKSGAGKLSVDVVPPADTLIVSNGTLSVTATCDNRETTRLAHRWSFNGDLTDSVGGATATTIGAQAEVNYVNGAAVRTGSDQSATYATSLNLGKALSAGEAVTIEIWAKRNSLTTNMRLFDWGLSNTDYICMSWHDNANVWVKTGNINRTGTPAELVNGCFANNVNYHLGVTFTANANGTTTIRVVRHNLDVPSEAAKTLTTTFPSCDLMGIIAGNLYLGHSQYSGEANNDAAATYDEVRVWKGLLSDDALALSAQKGPDATASDIAEIVAEISSAAPAARTLEIESGATFEIASGATVTQPILKGKGGAVSGSGTLKISDRILLNAGDSITASGTIDLTDAKVELVDPENLTKPFFFIKPAANATLTIVGTPEAVGLPTGWKLSVSSNVAKVTKSGFSIYLR